MARLSFYGGVGEIGGNKFLLEGKRTRLLLDFGLSFKEQKKYFDEFLQPRKGRGLTDWFATGLLPRMEGWKGIYRQDYVKKMRERPEPEARLDGVVLSHAHADHANMFHFLRPDVPLLMSDPSRRVLIANQELATTGVSEFVDWYEDFTYKEGSKGKKVRTDSDSTRKETRPIRLLAGGSAEAGEARVHHFPIDHSLPGASAYVLELDGVSLAYTGDIRFHGHHGELSRAFVEKAKEVDLDYLLVEGTRVPAKDATVRKDLSEGEVEAEITRLVKATKRMCLANWPIRDTDRMWSFLRAAKAAGRKLAVSLKQAYLLRVLEGAGADAPSMDDDALVIFVPHKGWCVLGDPDFPDYAWERDYKIWERDVMDREEWFLAEEIHERQAEFVVRCDFFDLKYLSDLRPDPGSTYVRSATQPFDDETLIDRQKAVNWIQLFGLEMHEPHASGHAGPAELREMIRALAPRHVVPIHTEHPEAYDAFVEGTRTKVLQPKLRNGDHVFEL